MSQEDTDTPYQIETAKLFHLEELSNLFEEYRSFYHQPRRLEASRNFLEQRIRNQDSIIFVASLKPGANSPGGIVGFAQIYPSFSSIFTKRILILNDLFVRSDSRKMGVARSLLNAASNFGTETKALEIVLETAPDNKSAQSLYESLGYKRNDGFYHYSLELE